MANKINAGPAGSYTVTAAPLPAATDIGCGFLVERQSDATVYTLSTTAATVQEQEFLVTLQNGETDGVSIDALHKAGSTVEPMQPTSGQLVNLRFATGNNVVRKGMPVTTAGAAGRFELASAGDVVFGYTEEVKNVNANDLLVLCRKA